MNLQDWLQQFQRLCPAEQAEGMRLLIASQPVSSPQPAAPERQGPAVIRQGDIYWARIPRPDAGPDSRTVAHPQVVISDDLFNLSRIETVVVCTLTTRLQLAAEPGNLRLSAGEGGLPRDSVAVVSQLASLPKAALGERIGQLSAHRVAAILDGIRFQQRAGW